MYGPMDRVTYTLTGTYDNRAWKTGIPVHSDVLSTPMISLYIPPHKPHEASPSFVVLSCRAYLLRVMVHAGVFTTFSFQRWREDGFS